MINLALRSEFSFQKSFGKVEDLVSSQKEIIGIADEHNTFSHYKLQQFCDKQGKKPIFGARVMAVRNPEEHVRPRGQFGPIYILLAKNIDGLQEIYRVIRRATECFYYRNHVGLIDIWSLSENIIVIAESYEISERVDYLGVSFNTPKFLLEKSTLPRVALNANKYLMPSDRETYELFAGRKKDNNTYPGYLLNAKEWNVYFDDLDAIANTYKIANECNVILQKAETLSYVGEEDLKAICIEGAKNLGVDLSDPVYNDRMNYELEIIESKNFKDYFLIVSDLVRYAKEKMFVGPGRGSSGGSLVCYLSGITHIDPIKHRLLFERFISPDRSDMPDIDIDFPDKHRKLVLKHLINKYGADKVRHVATITEMKAKSTFRDFAKELNIPLWELNDISSEIIVRPSADERYNKCIEDTLNDTKSGLELLENHPSMALCGNVEGHARTSGIHAAGILVSKDPLANFGGIDERNGSLMLDKRQSEYMNLLKIDCLGLITMTILQETAELACFDFREFYTLSLNDEKVFEMFQEIKLRGVFQFEGSSLKGLCKAIKVSCFEDLVAITALARPGPLHGGTASSFVRAHSGEEEIEYLINHPIVEDITKNTLGAVIYQEQLMEFLSKVGGMDWIDVEGLRKIVGKSAGREKFNTYKEKFIKGAQAHNMDLEEVSRAWDSLLNFGAYGFNRSHAVAYGVISYWTAYAKIYHPKEFLASFLNNTNEIEDQLRILREMCKTSGLKLVPVDPENSTDRWTVKDGILLGPLTNIKGIGLKTARKIMVNRKTGKLPARSLIAKLAKSETELDVLYPCRQYWGALYDDPKAYDLDYPPIEICDINEKGTYIFIAKVMTKIIRDLNEPSRVKKRRGEKYENNTKALDFIFEDDTDSIMGRIGRDDFDNMAYNLIDQATEGKDWYLIKGRIIKDGMRFIFIEEIHRLGDGITEYL